jgi:lipoteichoic acid synthase
LAFIFHPRVVKIIFLLMLASPLVIRAGYVDSHINVFTGTRFLGATQVLANDAVIYAFILSVFYVSFLSKVRRVPAVLLRVLGFVAYGIYAMDMAVLVSFNTHLTVDDAVTYAGYAPKYIAQISRKRDILLMGSAVPAVGLSLLVLFTRYTLSQRAHHVIAVLVVAGLLVASCFTTNSRYTHAWMYRNFIAYNLEVRSEGRGYSDAFVKGLDYTDQWVTEPKTPQQPNIIILLVESLSSYQSKYFSGLKDWTPNLDRIARQNVAFTNFYANGFCSNDGYISLLTGRPPIRPPASGRHKRGEPFNGFTDLTETLPMLLSQKGYATEFLMAGDFGFGGVGQWAQRLDFDLMEGHDHPSYDGWDRFHFNSAPDEALYNRINERISLHDGERYFMFVVTLTTHHPFVNPENGHKSEAETIMYGDKQLGLFYDKLMDQGFFDDGVLIILGDHHTMVPLKAGEVERFGSYRAAARVPMVVSFGNKKQAVVDGLHSQVDVFNSLKNMTTSTLRTSDWAGDIFNDKPAKYIAHRRGDYRDVISIFTDNQDYLVKLDGDNTRVIDNDAVSDAVEQELLNRVNAARVMEWGD